MKTLKKILMIWNNNNRKIHVKMMKRGCSKKLSKKWMDNNNR